jgi:magnesium-transporting ATPase (P-type)
LAIANCFLLDWRDSPVVFNARSDKQSAFVGIFSNKWLWGAVLQFFLLQVAVVYVPFLQQAFSTVSMSLMIGSSAQQ